jgi:hypothetical protein
MSIEDRIKDLSAKAKRMQSELQTEEATKTALVMPFIAALGYDVFDPREVVPEFTADVGTKKGEKVDYAVKIEDRIVALIECKKVGCPLSLKESNQLFRYFSVTSARIAILTDGIRYQFFTDLDEPNKMDERPFMELDLNNVREGHLRELKRLAKPDFDLDAMLGAASELKYLAGIKSTFKQQLTDPDEDFVKLFFSRQSGGKFFTQSVREQFTLLVRTALQQVITEQVSDRLRSALHQETPVKAEETDASGALSEDGIVTTDEELDGYRIVLAIVCETIDPSQVVHRDAKSYFAILDDDNNRKPICRLRFNSSKKYIGVFDDEKEESRHPIEKIEDIYKYAEQLRTAVRRYV